MLKTKTVLLGVTGSIAAYKSANIARMLVKLGYKVHVLMTKNATNFINPITFETLTGNKCLIDTFDRNFEYSVEHVALAKAADIVVIAPASANVIGKLACGIADDMLTTTVMACPCPKLISPAMNHNMIHNPIVLDNIAKLEKYGYKIIPPDNGMLANGDLGDGKMPSEESILEYILKEIAYPKDLSGKKVLVTAGATCESLDPVRYITNHSSGKMGYALARAAMQRGADVTLVTANAQVAPPSFVNLVKVRTAAQMNEAVLEHFDSADIVIKAAAVADYKPKSVANHKIKKSGDSISIELERTSDILAGLGSKKTHQFLCGFSMETENMLENSRGKLAKKNLDMIVANNLNDDGAGFGTDTNIVTIITDKFEETLPKMSKDDVSHAVLDKISALCLYKA